MPRVTQHHQPGRQWPSRAQDDLAGQGCIAAVHTDTHWRQPERFATTLSNRYSQHGPFLEPHHSASRTDPFSSSILVARVQSCSCCIRMIQSLVTPMTHGKLLVLSMNCHGLHAFEMHYRDMPNDARAWWLLPCYAPRLMLELDVHHMTAAGLTAPPETTHQGLMCLRTWPLSCVPESRSSCTACWPPARIRSTTRQEHQTNMSTMQRCCLRGGRGLLNGRKDTTAACDYSAAVRQSVSTRHQPGSDCRSCVMLSTTTSTLPSGRAAQWRARVFALSILQPRVMSMAVLTVHVTRAGCPGPKKRGFVQTSTLGPAYHPDLCKQCICPESCWASVAWEGQACSCYHIPEGRDRLPLGARTRCAQCAGLDIDCKHQMAGIIPNSP